MTKGERSLDRLVSPAQVIAVSQRFPTPSLVPIHDLDCSKLHARRTRRTHLPWHLRAVVRQDGGVYARVKDLELEPDPSALPGRPELFAFLARMVVGPPDSRGEELFDVTVCSPEWLAPGAGKWGSTTAMPFNVESFDKCEAAPLAGVEITPSVTRHLLLHQRQIRLLARSRSVLT